jgi:serine phosphatase RsbU (regulator of sigma subunit)
LLKFTIKILLLLLLTLELLQCKADIPTLHYVGYKQRPGDTLHYIKLFNHFNWNAELYSGNTLLNSLSNCKPDSIESDNADNLRLQTFFQIDSGLLNNVFVFRYKIDGSLLVKINGKVILRSIKPLRTMRFVLYDEEEEGYVYFTFPETRVTVDMIIANSDISEALTGTFEIETLQRKDDRVQSENSDNEITVLISFFFLAIGIMLFVLFFYHKESFENFYFASFCLLFSINYICDLFHLSSFSDSISFALSAYSLFFLVSYLSVVLTNQVRSKAPLILFSVILTVSVLIQLIFQYSFIPHIIIISVSIIYTIYNFFLGIYILFQGNSRKKWEIRFIKNGFFSALFFLFGILIFAIIVIIATRNNPNSSDAQTVLLGYANYSRIIGLLIIPITIAIIIGKRNGLNQKELKLQLLEIKTLSEQNLQKEKEKQSILAEQNIKLEEKVKARTLDLRHEKELVETKNREILDSIEYALRIQTAILPPLRIVKEYLTDSFILYRPKDIVAGDFYWMETTGDTVLFAACDCTGHGVSGALVSVLCNNALNRAVREYNLTNPASILNKTTDIIVENFSKSEEKIRDGMDISMCAYNTKTKSLDWAGANNPLWLIKNGEFIEIKGDKQCIGVNEHFHSFTNHHIELNSGDTIYIFSDGYADQFGGENGERKLTKRGFKDLLLSLQTISIQEQGKKLERFIIDHSGDEKQTDDILVMGVKV